MRLCTLLSCLLLSSSWVHAGGLVHADGFQAVPARIHEASWDAAQIKLNMIIEGQAGHSFRILNDRTENELYQARFPASGQADLQLSIPGDLPCEVRLKMGEFSDHRAVEHVPNHCDGGAHGTLTITHANWDQAQHSLQVEGVSDAYSEIHLQDQSSEYTLARLSTSASGQWFYQSILTKPPCEILVSQGDFSVRIPVANTGMHCRATLAEQPDNAYVIVAANDLGMHCADQDYQVFSILPPFNNVHAQVIRRGTGELNPPHIEEPSTVDVFYFATSNPNDPKGPNSINTTSQNGNGVFKTNFWQPLGASATLGDACYAPLYPAGVALPQPLSPDQGLLTANPAHQPDSMATPSLHTGHQHMPSVNQAQPVSSLPYQNNQAQAFDRYDFNVTLFSGQAQQQAFTYNRWFAADGIPITAIDDNGLSNPYPMMRVVATQSGLDPHQGQNVLAATDIVLPVSSEVGCVNCHAHSADYGNGYAADHASTSLYYDDSTPWPITRASQAPGPKNLENAAKLNILHLHDARFGRLYKSSLDHSNTPCHNGSEAACLANQQQQAPVQCNRCHYSTALDLAQTGPVDDYVSGGRQQTLHASMSRYMHHGHADMTHNGQKLFPDMPAPDDPARTPELAQSLLEQSCYQCHPGSTTKCLRGAMGGANSVCQDCHGNMNQVAYDFTTGIPYSAPDYNNRYTWLDQPRCESCHIGDAVTLQSMDISDYIVADDGLRLLQAYPRSDQQAVSVHYIKQTSSRFGEPFHSSQDGLYRFNRGHQGVMCKACHGPPHAIWPVVDRDNDINTVENDNLTAIQLQGYSGSLTECTVCHAADSLDYTFIGHDTSSALGGPHGMHVVNKLNWIQNHGPSAQDHTDECKACHGLQGEGTVLSRAATHRSFTFTLDPTGTAESKTVTFARGETIDCAQCHQNQYNELQGLSP